MDNENGWTLEFDDDGQLTINGEAIGDPMPHGKTMLIKLSHNSEMWTMEAEEITRWYRLKQFIGKLYYGVVGY